MPVAFGSVACGDDFWQTLNRIAEKRNVTTSYNFNAPSKEHALRRLSNVFYSDSSSALQETPQNRSFTLSHRDQLKRGIHRLNFWDSKSAPKRFTRHKQKTSRVTPLQAVNLSAAEDFKILLQNAASVYDLNTTRPEQIRSARLIQILNDVVTLQRAKKRHFDPYMQQKNAKYQLPHDIQKNPLQLRPLQHSLPKIKRDINRASNDFTDSRQIKHGIHKSDTNAPSLQRMRDGITNIPSEIDLHAKLDAPTSFTKPRVQNGIVQYVHSNFSETQATRNVTKSLNDWVRKIFTPKIAAGESLQVAPLTVPKQQVPKRHRQRHQLQTFESHAFDTFRTNIDLNNPQTTRDGYFEIEEEPYQQLTTNLRNTRHDSLRFDTPRLYDTLDFEQSVSLRPQTANWSYDQPYYHDNKIFSHV